MSHYPESAAFLSSDELELQGQQQGCASPMGSSSECSSAPLLQQDQFQDPFDDSGLLHDVF